MKNGVEKTFYPNGQLETEVTYKNDLPNGTTKRWHSNGVLASEMPVKGGIVEGTAREWNDHGVLLGSYEILNGCGVMKHWYPNGQLRGELPFVNGQTSGCIRVWDDTGGFIAEEFYIANKKVSRKKYFEACKNDPALPRYENNGRKPKLKPASAKYRQSKTPSVSEEKRQQHNKFIAEIRSKPNQAEARQWLVANDRRNIGEMTPESSREFIEKGYKTGASKIIVVDIQDETTNCLVVELPSNTAKRKRVFAWNNQMAQDSGFDPDPDWGQTELFVFLS